MSGCLHDAHGGLRVGKLLGQRVRGFREMLLRPLLFLMS